MTSNRWEKLRAIFNAAVRRQPSERLTSTRDAWCGDATLTAEVDSPLLGAQAAAGAQIGPPTTIGRYRIRCLVGEGGMGSVYEAEQEQPRRIVALKVIKAGLVSPELIRRFRQESQALARLQHPGIAQIYEAGEEDKGAGLQLFFAMEFIHGEQLVRYADKHRLNARERLELMVKVCDAVHHAHERGLIHRDLKPGNILVDERSQPKILDFGVARVTDSDLAATLHTEVGQLVGTLAYMSPEQVQGEPQALDRRSDVYALGVILYQILAARLPYRISPKLHEAMRAVQEDDPEPLSSIDRSYKGDVETIVAKALEKDKARRYSSVAELAADIRHYLQHEPITARPAGAIYQLEKFARRNKALVSGVLAVFVVLVAGVIVSTGQTMRARRAEGVALNEAATAKAVSDFLRIDLLAQASSSNQWGRAAKPDPDLKVRTALDRAAARIGGKFDRQPEVEAAIHETIGQTYLDLGQYPEARKHLQRALDLYRRLLGDENPKTLGILSRLGATFWLQGKYPEAEALSKQTLELQRRVLGPQNSETLKSMSNLANSYSAQGKYAQAEVLLKQTLALQRRVLGPEHPDTLASMNNLANTFNSQGKHADAEVLHSQTLEIKRRVLGPEHPDTLKSMNNLAYTYRMEGKYAQAETLFSQTLESKRRALGPEHPNTLLAMSNLAGDYYLQGKYAQAEALSRRALEIKRRVLGAEHPDTLVAMDDLADACYQQKKYADAETLFNQILEISRRVLGPENPYTLTFLSDITGMYQRRGRYAEAETYAAQTLKGLRHAVGPENPDTMDAAINLALAYHSQRKFADSEPLARQVVELDRKKRPEDWQRFRAESLLGASLARQGKFVEAEPLLLEGYKGMAAQKDRIAVPDRYHLDRAADWIIELYVDWDKPEKAAEWRKAQTAL